MALVKALRADDDNRPLLKDRVDAGEIVAPRISGDTALKHSLWDRLVALCPSIESKSRLVVINPNAGDLLPIRAWPLRNYIELTRRLLDRDGLHVIIMGTKEASSDAARMLSELQHPRLIDLTAKTKFEELLPLFELSDLLITNDSGPAHFASLTPIHIMTFFGPETPQLYAPLSPRNVNLYSNYHCSPCLNAYNHRTTSCRDNKCLQRITVDEVFEVAVRQLAERDQAVTA
jgi:ADP-heptose:LPS heptosyltransferase